MKTIGLIGGMSWESSAVYYQQLNELTRTRLGGLHSAPLILWSFDFAGIEALQARGDWATATEQMIHAGRSLESAGAQCLVICTNTMHKMAGAVADATAIPLLHIADATATAVRNAGVKKPLLLATRYTMEGDFYTGRLRDRHGINVVVPDADARAQINHIIYEELCRGIVRPESKALYQEIIARRQHDRSNSRADEIDGVILGCTEIGLLLTADDVDLAVFDTTRVHVEAVLDYALGN